MASRVNTQFVVLLVSGLIVVLAGGLYIGNKAIRKSGEDLVKEGDKFAAEGDFEKATGAYGRAVNKDQRNPAWITKWLDSMQKTTPSSQQTYMDRYFKEYRSGLRALAESDRKDLANFRRLLDEHLALVYLQGGQLGAWEQLARLADDMIKLWRGDEHGKDTLRRYRGIAAVGAYRGNPDMKEEDLKAGYEDLQAATKADPNDEAAAANTAVMELMLAEAALRRSAKDDSDRYLKQARERLVKQVEEHGPAPFAAFQLMVVENTVLRQPTEKDRSKKATPEEDAGVKQTDAERLRLAAEAGMKPVVKLLREMPAESIDPFRVMEVAFAASALLPNGMDNMVKGSDVAVDLLERVAAAHPKDAAQLIFTAGALARGAGEWDTAEQLFRRVVAMKPMPLSLQGAMLRERRAQSISELLTLAFARWEQGKSSDERDKAQADAQELRKQLTEFVSEASNPILAADARIELMKGNFMGARSLATRYNDQTNRSDIDMLAIEGEILRRMGNSGAAKEIYTRILQRQPGALVALLRMSELETNAGNYQEARRYMAQAALYRPDLPELKEKEKVLAGLARGEEDPSTKALQEAQKYSSGIARNIPKAIEVLRRGLDQQPGDKHITRGLVVLLVRTGDREGAKKVLDEAIALDPKGTVELQRFRAALDKPDQIEAILIEINELPIQEWQKDLARYEVYAKAGRMPEARERLQAALKQRPDDPLVVEMAFQDAASRAGKAVMDRRKAEEEGNTAEVEKLKAVRDEAIAEAGKLASVAETRNLDQVNGLLFRARIEVLKGSYDDAIRTLREAVAKDKVSLLGWRLLGMLLLETREYQAAVDALTKAIEISPTDLLAAKDYIKGLFATRRLTEALIYARRVEATLGGDAEFAEMLLQLESVAPNGDPTRAIQIRNNLREQDPDNKGNKVQLCALLIDDKQYDKAQELVSEFRRADPMDAQAVQLDASLHGKKGDKEGAMKVYQDFLASLKEEQRTEKPYIEASMTMEELGMSEAAEMLLKMGRRYQDPKTQIIDRQLGDMAFRANRYEAAIEAYRKVVETGSPEDARAVRKRIVESLLRLKKFAEADQELKAFGEEGQKDTTVLLLAAESAGLQKDRARAKKLLDQIISLDPKNGLAFLKRADLFRSDISMQREVEQDYLQVLQLNPQYNPARARLAALYAETGRTDQAIDQFRQAVQNAPQDDQVRNAYIDLLVQRGRSGEAVQAVDEIVKLRPEDSQWLFRGATLAARAGSPDKAAEYFGAMWKLRQAGDTAYFYATSLMNKTPPDLNTVNEVLTSPNVFENDSVQLRLVRARWLRLKQKMAEASKEVLAALAMVNPDRREDAIGFLSGVELVYSKQEEVIAALARMEEKAPFTEWLAYQANLIRMRDPQLQSQVRAAMESLYTNAKSPMLKGAACGIIGGLEMVAESWQGAADAFLKGSKADPENPELLNNYAYIAATKLNKPQDALEYAEKAVKVVPNSANFIDTLASVHIRLKNYDQAAELLGQAITVATNDGERVPVLIHLAQARLGQGNRVEAKRLLALVEQLLGGVPEIRRNYESDLKELHKALD